MRISDWSSDVCSSDLEPRQPQDADTALSFSMEGYNGVGSPDRPGALLPYAWAPGWNSPQAWNKFQQEVGGNLRGGNPGQQLFAVGATQTYFHDVPDRKSTRLNSSD